MCAKPLTIIKYNDFCRQFLIAEPNKKLRDRKGYFTKDYVKI